MFACRFCGWEFSRDGFGQVDDGGIEGEAELEIDGDGNLIYPNGGLDDTHFPPWHGIASAWFDERHERGFRDGGAFSPSDDWEFDFDDYVNDGEHFIDRQAHPVCRCPDCGREFRTAWKGAFYCPDCACQFTFDSYGEPSDNADQADDPQTLIEKQIRHGEVDAAFFRSGTPIVVCPRGGGDFRTIEEAWRRPFSPGRPLLLRPGLHDIWLNLNRPLHIIGDGPRDQIIFRGRDGSALSVSHPCAALSNLTIQGFARINGGRNPAVQLWDGTIEDCDITSDSLAAVRMHGGLLQRCRIHDAEEAGILASGGDVMDCDVFHKIGPGVVIVAPGVFVSHCRIRKGHDIGIAIARQGRGHIVHCEIAGNSGAGVRVAGFRSTLWNCRINAGHRDGIFVASGGSAKVDLCEIGDNLGSGLCNDGGRLHVERSRIHHCLGVGVRSRASGITVLRSCVVAWNRLGGIRCNKKFRTRARICRIFGNGPDA